MTLKRHKKFLLYVIILLLMDVISSHVFIPKAHASIPTTTPMSRLGTDEASLPHVDDDPNQWASKTAQFSGGLYVPKSINDSRSAWHSARTSNQQIIIGWDGEPYDYTPPAGYEVHSILRYPVYRMRTYDVQVEKSGCNGGMWTDNECNPYYFDGVAGEDNRWAKPPNIDSPYDWAYYPPTVTRYNPNLKMDMEYYRFRTAQIRKKNDDGLGAGGSVWHKYDYKIQPIKTTPPPTDPPPTNPPPVDGSSGCQQPKEVPPRYEYEMDVEVTRIDARTVDKGTQTDTDVYVKRRDFSSSRNQVKNEFQQYINETEAQKADCESKKAQYEAEKQKAESEKAQAESQKASAESAKATCEATPPDKDGKKPDCSKFTSDISTAQSKISEAEAKIAEFEAKIEDAETFIQLYEEYINKAKNELNYIQSNESSNHTVSPRVVLRHGNNVVSNINVTLSEGEGPKRYVFPKWNVPDDGTIMAQINENGPYNEFMYQPLQTRSEVSLGYNNRVGNVLYPSSQSNNWKSTPIYVASYASASCPPPNQYFQPSTVEGVVRTVNDNGNQREIKERITSTFSMLPRNEMRAGFGFEYRIQTVYQNFDTEPNPSNATGTKNTDSYFPTKVNYLPYVTGGAKTSFNKNGQPTTADEGYGVSMETSNPSVPRSETRTWNLPPVAIEEYSGNIFSIRNNDYINHPNRNPSENLLMNDKDGKPLNRWYVDFTQPDGEYQFKVRTYNAGVNHLNTCHTGKVMVKGSVIGDPNGNDDFIKRTVTPSNPFPGGIGWNWKGNESSIAGLNDWYNNWYEKPSEIPNSQYNKTFYLTIDKIQEIKNYNEQNNYEYELGNSIFKSVNIPNVR